jgi:hypothetical protein
VLFAKQCLKFHPTPEHDVKKNHFEKIRADFNEKLEHIHKIGLPPTRTIINW